ncbi:hypothetical protein MMT17_29075, partial [Escherichia coli]|nr:hypothetical protein [Escherichia coli]
MLIIWITHRSLCEF